MLAGLLGLTTHLIEVLDLKALSTVLTEESTEEGATQIWKGPTVRALNKHGTLPMP